MWVPVGEREGGMNLEIRIDIYTLRCVQQIASGSPAQCSCVDLEEWDGAGRKGGPRGRRRVYADDLLHYVPETNPTL